MNAGDILHYGQQTVLAAVETIAAEEWDLPGACGIWSMKDIVAHLASYERVLEDILGSFLGDDATPYLDRLRAGNAFNDAEVEARRSVSVQDAMSELAAAHGRTVEMLARIPSERRRQPGTLPWYGTDYALDDVIVYMYYGHKREHSAQIAAFRDRLAAAPADSHR
jgi:DNA-binding transcriptional LysR family regulator